MDDHGTKIQFHYVKSNLFRVVHADGAWGGLTPDLQVFFSLFNSRPPIPQILGFEVSPEGALQEVPSMKVCRDGILRELEVGIVMSPENTQALIDFLKDRLADAQRIKANFPNKTLTPAEGEKTK